MFMNVPKLALEGKGVSGDRNGSGKLGTPRTCGVCTALSGQNSAGVDGPEQRDANTRTRLGESETHDQCGGYIAFLSEREICAEKYFRG